MVANIAATRLTSSERLVRSRCVIDSSMLQTPCHVVRQQREVL
jgi:hypothetical protein